MSDERPATSNKRPAQKQQDAIPQFSHLDRNGKLRMVRVTEKPVTQRQAVARAELIMTPETLALIRANRIAKGDVLATAKLAGIVAAKRTDELIPLCHALRLTDINVTFAFEQVRLLIETRAESVDRTGPELEALTAASIAALTVYDMCKAVNRGMVIRNISLVKKSGGKSGTWVRRLSRDSRRHTHHQ